MKDVNDLGFSKREEVLSVTNINKVLNPYQGLYLSDTTVSIFVRLCAEYMQLAYCNPAYFIEVYYREKRANENIQRAKVNQEKKKSL